MARVKVDIRKLGEAWDKASGQMRGAMERGLFSGVLRGQHHLMENSPVDTGLYQASWAVNPKSNTHIELGNSAPHAPIIEYGARPHNAPLGPLLAWAKRVLKSSSQPPYYDEQVQRLARGVQKKIRERGQEPKHVLTDAIPDLIKMVEEEIAKELERI